MENAQCENIHAYHKQKLHNSTKYYNVHSIEKKMVWEKEIHLHAFKKRFCRRKRNKLIYIHLSGYYISIMKVNGPRATHRSVFAKTFCIVKLWLYPEHMRSDWCPSNKITYLMYLASEKKRKFYAQKTKM